MRGEGAGERRRRVIMGVEWPITPRCWGGIGRIARSAPRSKSAPRPISPRSLWSHRVPWRRRRPAHNCATVHNRGAALSVVGLMRSERPRSLPAEAAFLWFFSTMGSRFGPVLVGALAPGWGLRGFGWSHWEPWRHRRPAHCRAGVHDTDAALSVPGVMCTERPRSLPGPRRIYLCCSAIGRRLVPVLAAALAPFLPCRPSPGAGGGPRGFGWSPVRLLAASCLGPVGRGRWGGARRFRRRARPGRWAPGRPLRGPGAVGVSRSRFWPAGVGRRWSRASLGVRHVVAVLALFGPLWCVFLLASHCRFLVWSGLLVCCLSLPDLGVASWSCYLATICAGMALRSGFERSKAHI